MKPPPFPLRREERLEDLFNCSLTYSRSRIRDCKNKTFLSRFPVRALPTSNEQAAPTELHRIELVNLHAEEIRSALEGIILTPRCSKTDQSADGVEIGIPKDRKPATCPVTLLPPWIDYAKISPARSSGRSNDMAKFAIAG